MVSTRTSWLLGVGLALSATSCVASPIEECPGYGATNVVQSGSKLTADLDLAGDPCNTYGDDIESLQLEVTYETENRLHVKIWDTQNQVYQVPSGVLPPPDSNSTTQPSDSAIQFNYVENPFSFAITRTDTQETLFNTSGFQFVFQSQYLHLQTSLPNDANLYGLGEHADTFRLPTTDHTRTLWSRDAGGVPPGTNLYGNHPMYYDHRGSEGTHGVFLRNSNGMDIKINNTAEEGQTLSFNTLGGIVDLYFVAGPSPLDAVEQYSEVVGKSAMTPYWSLGFHQCSFKYPDVYHVAEVVANYSAADIPLQTMWTDIDYMDLQKIFTLDPGNFPLHKMRELVAYLHDHNQNYIVMVDPAVAYQDYETFNRASEKDVLMKTNNGSIYKGVVWPGVTAFPDWFAPQTQNWWNDEFSRFFDPDTGVDIDGLWIDMNEAASFCNWPCDNPEQEADDQDLPADPAPTREPPRPIPGFPDDFQPPNKKRFETRDLSSGLPGRNLLEPPYMIKNEAGKLSDRTIDTSLIHANGLAEYDTHNLYGTMMSSASRGAMLHRRPESRPLVITRSTFAGAGTHVGHWLGDNDSLWEDYRAVIGAVLNFASLFQVPMVGADVCGFLGTTTESLCSRWAMLGAFSPFYRNHNVGDDWQEFYLWPDTVAVAARKAIAARYQLLDYFYTALYRQSTSGTPSLNPLWFFYPEDANTFPIDLQYFYGDAVLVSPVTEEDSTSVEIYLPDDIFYDFWTYNPVRGNGSFISLTDVELTDIPVHLRGGNIIPMRIESAMTTNELREKGFDIVIAPDLDGNATGRLYLDDGDSIVQETISDIDLTYSDSSLTITGEFGYQQDGANVSQVTLLGVEKEPEDVLVNDEPVDQSSWEFDAASINGLEIIDQVLKMPSHEWEKLITLPKSETEWKAQASREIFQMPPDKVAKKGGNFHVGEKVSSVHIRDLGGWCAASKIQRSHYLAARILWHFKDVKNLKRPDFEEITSLSKEADDLSRKYLKGCKDWKAYREDVRANAESIPRPGHHTDLGSFTRVRVEQLSIPDRSDEIKQAERSPPRTRSAATMNQGEPMDDEGDAMDEEGDAMDQEDTEPSNIDVDQDMTDSNPSLPSSAGLSRVVTEHSEHSAADPKANPGMYTPSPGEDFVNAAALCFLGTLTDLCNDVTLRWEIMHHTFVTELGAATITAITDGRLVSKERRDVHSIVEVKPHVLLHKADNVLMQMGMEMLGWILDCEVNKRPKRRYFMVSQHRHEMFVTVAKFDRKYMTYLQDERKVDPKDSFLDLYCFGPFNIFDSRHMFTFGRIILTLTIQLSMDS
ncbi:hypothetical protein FQN54_006546 [Arachnomyces sp. PD_36]|nr:hypothetical protein FQN54_006546 [Arachnomyces sp. PD_36]